MRARRRQRKRNLIVVVGTDDEERARLARGLVNRGDAVVLCDGPPGCSLVKARRCPIVDTVDAVVVMPVTAEASREIAFGLTLCAREARCAVTLEPTVVHVMSGSRRVTSSDPDVVGTAIDEFASGRH